MIIEHTATHLGKKSYYIYKNIHNRRIGAYLNGKQKTALKYVSELVTRGRNSRCIIILLKT